jgi:hypothetical protein
MSATSPVCSRVVLTLGMSLAAGQRAKLSLFKRQVIAIVLLKLSSNVMSPEI